MSMEEIDRGHQGAKRASWMKVHFRDLALQICEDHRDADVEELAGLFLEALQKYPDYMQSIAVYVMANTRASLRPRDGRRSGLDFESKVVKAVAAKAMDVLMTMTMPSGKTLAQSSGAECVKAGGWLKAVGMRVGPKGIVGEKLTEKDLQTMLQKGRGSK